MSKWAENTIIVVAYPDRGAGNDPKPFFLCLGGGGSLSPSRLNIFTVGNMGVMIGLGQGGLRSLSASSYDYFKNALAHLGTINYLRIKTSSLVISVNVIWCDICVG